MTSSFLQFILSINQTEVFLVGFSSANRYQTPGFLSEANDGEILPDETKLRRRRESPARGKTSLLFQFALNIASASQTNHVVFICHRKRIESNPPFLSQGIDPSSSDAFNRIQMKYVDDDEGLRNYFAAFHLHLDLPPAALVIDDFGDYFTNSKGSSLMNSRARDMAMVRTLALCHNAIAHANKKAACELVLSETSSGDSPRSLFIYKRWIPSIFTIKGHGDGSFLLTSNGSSQKSAKYSIALQYLILEEIVN
ncbi:uncharacterized protein LOC103828758 isoform X1 [Brassica rapa]|uniref:uncharacterized protein LOC103828758 isoform X1 n=1 Tax=Brassica campestris TaxID=3711 RepID=UPI0004F1BA7C|nr:uncharacterized protein LOC103828758 isoform X1 [Brassica rapa]